MRELVAKHQHPVLVNYGAATRPRGGVLPSREFGGKLVAWPKRARTTGTMRCWPSAWGALGVVFGDIGTSPLYTLRECLHGIGTQPTRSDVLGISSLIFGSLVMVVTVKYLVFIMRAHNNGEAGIFALLAVLPGSRAAALNYRFKQSALR